MKTKTKNTIVVVVLAAILIMAGLQVYNLYAFAREGPSQITSTCKAPIEPAQKSVDSDDISTPERDK